MFPPSLPSSAVVSHHHSILAGSRLVSGSIPTLVRAGVGCQASRTFFGWRRPNDYASHLDPIYARFSRYRTLKTRAKLLANLRRRGKFDWDFDQKPFFTSKHVRWASHYDGRHGGPRWPNEAFEGESGKRKNIKDHERTDAEAGFELSQREKKWKELMEAMRKKIEQDPYEAVFGRRFPQFWSPLIPGWMREEMGLQSWPKWKELLAKSSSEGYRLGAKPDVTVAKGNRSEEKTDIETKPVTGSSDVSDSYSYSSSTSWDSRTNKTRRTEWDSVSRKTKRYEYDPISNRMVQVDAPDPDSKIGGPPLDKAHGVRTPIPIPTQDATELASSITKSTNSTAVSSERVEPAALAKLPKDDLDLLTADNVRASMGKVKPSKHAIRPSTQGEKAAMESRFDQKSSVDDFETATILRQRSTGTEKISKNESTTGKVPKIAPASILQTSVERMQSKDLAPKLIDVDDAAAHESTEPLEYSTKVPKSWAEQVEILQGDRVKRTVSKRPYPVVRWLDDINARKAACEAELTSKANTLSEEAAEHQAKLEKANALLEAEVQEQKLRMQSYESRYAHKVRSLREELETAYRQSSKHSEAHVERIQNLETELARAQTASGDASSVNAKTPVATNDSGALTRGEGDFCANITKFAGSGKWYKRPMVDVQAMEREAEKAAQKARDQALVREVREIYERKYGVIDTQHRQIENQESKETDQPQAMAVDSDVRIGKAVTERDNRQAYLSQSNNLEVEIAREEKEAYEAIAARERETVGQSGDRKEQKPTTENNPTPTPTPSPSQLDPMESEVQPSSGLGVQWAEPPVYKVLAYDSGNDKFSTATTTSNFTPSERPISIPQALSQLYQPARFVSHFAELQRDGYQVIYGTRDLLVFKKVKGSDPVPHSDTGNSSAQQTKHLSLADHGLLKPMENAVAQEAAMFHEQMKPIDKPYDPTSIENGSLKPKENALAQEAAEFYDERMRRGPVNPVDGMTKLVHPDPSTGNFASPTGFVNYGDDVVPADSAMPKSAFEPGRSTMFEEDVDYVHYPRVRRQEAVFSGTATRRQSRQRREERKHSRRRGAGAIKWALSVGVAAAVLSYGVGTAAAMARREKRDVERWQEVLEGKRGRWE